MAIAGTGGAGNGKKVDPGDKHGAMSNARCTVVSLPTGTPPSGVGGSSGVVKHGRSGKDNKVENLNGMPTVH